MNVIFIMIAFGISTYIAWLIIPRILLISFRKNCLIFLMNVRFTNMQFLD